MRDQIDDGRGVSRRGFLGAAVGVAAVGAAVPSVLGSARAAASKRAFEISLAQWSLHRMHGAGELDTLGFPAFAKERVGVDAIEFVNSFFKDKARDTEYLGELKRRSDDLGVTCLLIMCDGEGRIGDPDAAARGRSVDNHVKWIEAAAALGCHSIRVNAASAGSYEEQQKLAADGLGRLTRLAAGYDISVLVENHGGLSSNGAWLAGVMEMVDHPGCGTLPDFGNFCMDWSRSDEDDAWYDRYLGMEELLPFAKAVSAKSYAFDEEGNETSIDYRRILKTVLDAGYSGYVGIEYEGSQHSELDGVLLTHELLERVRNELS